MNSKDQKRKTNHVVIVTSDAEDANVRQFHIRTWLLKMIIILLCIIVGVMIGYFFYEEELWSVAKKHNDEQQKMMNELENENISLQSEIDGLSDQIQILSDTVNQKVDSERELKKRFETQSLPTEFPLNGSASMEEVIEGDPMYVFTASPGTSLVVATASGTVMAVNDDAEYGHNVWIDHGNGYVTIYRNKGETTVEKGDIILQGMTLFVIGEENTKLGYQMRKDDAFISPMSLLEIRG